MLFIVNVFLLFDAAPLATPVSLTARKGASPATKRKTKLPAEETTAKRTLSMYNAKWERS